METARLILDPPAQGAWNMAVDQALLETANSTGLITLRFYRWSEPTLSLGYFQRHLDRKLHPPSKDCSLVRRRTGGGAILHDHELTYSLCIPSENRWSKRNSELYRLVHLCVIEILQSLGIESEIYGDTISDPNASVEANQNDASTPTVDPHSFMCFDRRADGDIVIRGRKVVGSAQRRIKKALLQHGSILLKRSNYAPSLSGIVDLENCDFDSDEFSQMLAKRVFKCLRVQSLPGVINQLEKEAAKNAYSSQFNFEPWNQQR